MRRIPRLRRGILLRRKPPRLCVGAFISCEYAYKPGSVLTAIYLRASSPMRSSHLGSGRASLYAPIPVLLRIEFTAADAFTRRRVSSYLAFPPLPAAPQSPQPAVYLCCTFPEVAFGGRYPLSLPCGARTFLMDGLSPCPRGCPAYSQGLL